VARKKRRKRTKPIPGHSGDTAGAIFQDGLQHHQAGRLVDAAGRYHAALAIDADHADSHHLLGVIAMQSGEFAEAVTRLETAIGLKDQAPAYHDHLGLTLRQMGRGAEALSHHRRALELDPKFAAGHNNLAGTLLGLGQLDEAEASARQALTLSPGDPEVLLNMGQILLAEGRASGAVDALEAADRVRPGSPQTLVQLATALQRAGRRPDAETQFRRAVDLAPENAQLWSQYGGFLLSIEKFAESAEAFAEAARLNPDDTSQVVNRGISLWRGGKLDDAEAAFDAGLARAPGDVAALLGKAAVISATGDNDGAYALYRQALDADPDNLDVYNNLSTEVNGISDADAERLAGLLGDRNLSDDDRAKAGFALGAYLRRCGHHETAFEIYATANEFRAASLSAAGNQFDPEIHSTHINARTRLFSPDFFAARRHMGADDQTPVFVIGMPRSGTTLVEQILASHARVHGAGERRDMAEIGIERLPAMIGGTLPYPECLKQITPQHGQTAAAQYLDALRVQAPKAARVIDKMPFNFTHLGLIALLFPKARIIHCRRDMRDVALSCYFTNFADNHPWSTRLPDIVHFIKAYRRLMAFWRRVLPISILEVDYEHLVENQEAESRRMIDYLGLKWDPACLNFHQTERPVSTAARAQVRRPMYTSSVGRWRAYEKWIGALNLEPDAPVDPD